MKIQLLNDSLVDMEELVECASGNQLILLGYLVDRKLKNMEREMPGLDLAILKHQLIRQYESTKKELHPWLQE